MAKKQPHTSTPGGDSSLAEVSSIGDVKRYLARLLQRVERGRVTVKKANCLTQICNVLINAIVDHELEERIEQLEGKRASQSSQSTTITVHSGGQA
ncbi:MAG: hypothetical protein ABL970_00985 [Nitrospira sp.]